MVIFITEWRYYGYMYLVYGGGELYNQTVQKRYAKLREVSQALEDKQIKAREDHDFTFDPQRDIAGSGYYSSMRFLLPPYITDEELESLRVILRAHVIPIDLSLTYYN